MLIESGFGNDHHDIARRFTWRQINHYAAIVQRRANHRQADSIQGMAQAFAGKDLPKLLRALRS